MKKQILTLLLLLMSVKFYSQVEKGNIIIRLDGNYNKTLSEHGVTTNSYANKSKIMNVGPSIGIAISNNFEAGIVLDYFRSFEERYHSVLTMNKHAQVEKLQRKQYAFMPGIYLGYYRNITEKISFNTNFNMRYGNLHSEMVSQWAGIDYISWSIIVPGPGDGSISVYSESEQKFEYASASLLPEISYYITPAFGLSLGLGGVEYALVDWESDNSTFVIDFHPRNWRLGLRMKF